MTMTLGAHEALELHEILNDSIHGLNTLRLYRQYAQEQQLQMMMDRHINALTMEYNNLVHMATQMGASHSMTARHTSKMQSMNPTYGLHNPQAMAPASSVNDIDDIDVTLCLVNCHKQTATLKMRAALEIANPAMRRAIQQGANDSADMAYESFQYANHQGYYQIPTLKDTTQETFMHSYQAAPMNQTGMHMM